MGTGNETANGETGGGPYPLTEPDWLGQRPFTDGTAQISVVIPTIRPRRRMLSRAVGSVGRQTLLPTALYLVDDRGKEGSAPTRQRGTDHVTTPYVAYLDDDDELLPSHLDHLVAALELTGADLVYPWFEVVGGLDPLAEHAGVPWDDAAPHTIPVTFLARTDAVREAGGWWFDPADPNQQQVGGEDDRLLRGLLGNGAKIVHLPEVTWRWHHHGENTSGLPTRWA